MPWLILLAIVLVGLALWAIYDVLQTEHAVVRTFPIVGHLRYWVDAVGPELRQYIVTDNDEERPFNRDQRRWIYASAKGQNNSFGFGSDNDMETAEHYVLLKHAAFPYRPPGAGALEVASHADDAPGADALPASLC